MEGKKTKESKQAKSESGSAQFTMRVMESSVCEVCKRQCARGIRYLAPHVSTGSYRPGSSLYTYKKASLIILSIESLMMYLQRFVFLFDCIKVFDLQLLVCLS